MRRTSWAIFYDDGSSFSSEDGEPHAAPTEGFICAVGYDERDMRYICQGKDFYCFDLLSGCWLELNKEGLLDRLRRNLLYAYKEGRTVSRVEFADITMLAGEWS